jgi:hypothetical protein
MQTAGNARADVPRPQPQLDRHNTHLIEFTEALNTTADKLVGVIGRLTGEGEGKPDGKGTAGGAPQAAGMFSTLMRRRDELGNAIERLTNLASRLDDII